MKCPKCDATILTRTRCDVCGSSLVLTSMHEPGYWEEKAAEERQMYREEEAEERKRMFPTGE